MKKWTMLLAAIVLAGCSGRFPTSEQTIIDWVDFVKWDGTTYSMNYDSDSESIQWQKAQKLGEVRFTLDGNAGVNHKTKDGDASYLPEGTEIYAIEGYSPDFRVFASGRMFEVSEPAHAETLGSFLDVAGKVERVILQSPIDGSFAGEFAEEHAELFIEHLLALPYEASYTQSEGEPVFFALQLNDGSLTSSVYWEDTGYITYGAAADEQIKNILEKETAAHNY